MVETNSYDLDKNFQFEYCRRLPLPRFVLSCFLFCGMVRNGISSCFLFRRKVRKGIPRVCFYFCSAERNSELFSLPLKGSEGNSKSLLLFLFRGMEIRDVFSSAEGFGTEFREIPFCGIAGIPSEITICSVNFVFRGIIFLSEIPNPTWDKYFLGRVSHVLWTWRVSLNIIVLFAIFKGLNLNLFLPPYNPLPP